MTARPVHDRRAQSQAAATRAKRSLRLQLALCLAASLLVHAGLGLYMQRCRLHWGNEKLDQKIAEVAETPPAPDFHWTQQQQPAEEPFDRPLAAGTPVENAISPARDQQADLSVEPTPLPPGETTASRPYRPNPADLLRAEQASARKAEQLAAERLDRQPMAAEAVGTPAEQPRVSASPSLPAAQAAPTILRREQSRPTAAQPPPAPAAAPRAVAAVASLARQSPPPEASTMTTRTPQRARSELPGSSLASAAPEQAPPEPQRPLPEHSAAPTVATHARVAGAVPERPLISVESTGPAPAIVPEKLARRESPTGRATRIEALAGPVSRVSLAGELPVTIEREMPAAAAPAAVPVYKQPPTRIERDSMSAVTAVAPSVAPIELARSASPAIALQRQRAKAHQPALTSEAGEIPRPLLSKPIAASAQAAPSPAPVATSLQLTPSEPAEEVRTKQTELAMALTQKPRPPVDAAVATLPVTPDLPNRRQSPRSEGQHLDRSTTITPARVPAVAQVPMELAVSTALPPAEEFRPGLSPAISSQISMTGPVEVPLDWAASGPSLVVPEESPLEPTAFQRIRVFPRRNPTDNLPYRERANPGAPARAAAAAKVPVELALSTTLPASEEMRSSLSQGESAEPAGRQSAEARIEVSTTGRSLDTPSERPIDRSIAPADPGRKKPPTEERRDDKPLTLASPAREPAAAKVLVYLATSEPAPSSEERRPAMPSPSAETSRVQRIPAKIDSTAGIDRLSARISMEATEGRRAPNRNGNYGGNSSAERTVAMGLEYLARCQFADGRWSLHRVPEALLPVPDPAWGETQSDTAATGLALLALLGAGYTHVEGRYQAAMDRGLAWLIAAQKEDGDLFNGGTSFAWFYSQGIGAIALCEAYGVTADPKLREPARKAIDFILRSQHPELGGWRYYPRAESDTSVTGWQLMALKSAQMSGLPVPERSFGKIRDWLDSAQSGHHGGLYSYNPRIDAASPAQPSRAPSLAMTAEGLLMRVYLGWPADHPGLIEGADHLLHNLPSLGDRRRPTRDAYYWYYATQFMFQMQGPYWLNWNNALLTILENTQVRSGPWAGSWHPTSPVPDRWGQSGGRLYVTAMHVLTLEVYYRHLPLFELRSKSR